MSELRVTSFFVHFAVSLCLTMININWNKYFFLSLFCLSSPQPLQRIENDVELLGEHLSLGAGLHYSPAAHPALTPHSTQLHFLSHDPLPQEFFGVVSIENTQIKTFNLSVKFCCQAARLYHLLNFVLINMSLDFLKVFQFFFIG